MAEPLTPLGQQIDDAVAINRAATPARATTQRRVPRVSIAELNAMDRDMLHERLRDAIKNSDNRGPVESVLDLLDLPRNTIANIVLPGVAEAKRAEGDKGTFGMGRVHFSDLLEKMGLGPGVVRGVIGFVGDVATDPLTYFGPGAVAKTASKIGEVGVAASRFGSLDRALTREVGRVVKGGTLATDTSVGRAVHAAVEGEEGLAKLRTAAKNDPAELANLVSRAAKGTPEGGVVRKGLTKIGLAEPTSTGGILSHLGTDLTTATPAEAAKAQAAKDLYLDFGKGTEPGLALGKDATSQIAHIPLTNIGIRVPAISQSARRAQELLTLARDTNDGTRAMAALNPLVAKGVAGAATAGRAVDELTEARAVHRAKVEPLGAEIANAQTELDKLRGESPEVLGTRHPVDQLPTGPDAGIDPVTAAPAKRTQGFAGIKDTIRAIDPGTIEGEAGAGTFAAKIDEKLTDMIDGPRPTGRGAFLSDSRAAYLADPENGSKALLARALRNKRHNEYSIARHGDVVGLNPERLRVGDTWKMGDDTLTVLEHDPETGVSTLKWEPMTANGTVSEGERILKVGPTVTAYADGSKVDVSLPANEHSFIGSLPTPRDPLELAGPHRERVAAQLTEAFGDKASNSLPVMDAYAKGWARAKGKTVEDFYKGLRIEKGGKPGEGALFDIPAWHGSPHQFDKFDISKIGTGEGAQIYGHGLYFSSAEDVAKYYRKTLSTPSFIKDGKVIAIDTPEALAEYFRPGDIVPSYGGTHDRVISFNPSTEEGGWNVTVQSVIKENGQWVNEPGERPRTHYTRPDAKEFQKKFATDGWKPHESGRLYKVELAPEEYELLDWDEPLGLQGNHVANALDKIPTDEGYMKYAGYQENHTGKSVYQGLASELGPEEASKVLKEAGIRGIRYKGRTSNVTNYVIFDDTDVAVKEMFQRAGKGKPRGSYEMLDNGDRVIRALTNPNASTLPHEVAHDFYNLLPQMDPKLAEKAAKAVGAESHAASTVEHHENFARGFEDYLRTGEAPSKELKSVFQKFKQWLVDIYKSIVGTPLEGKMNPELKAVFDEMLTKAKDSPLVADAESLAKRDRLIQATQELAEARRAHVERTNEILANAKQGAADAEAAIHEYTPGDNAALSAQELITLGRMSDRARAERDLAEVAHEQLTAGMEIRKDLVARFEEKGVLNKAVTNTLNETQQALYHMASDDPEFAAQYANLLKKKVDAYQSLTTALRTPLHTVMSGADKVHGQIAAAALGMADDQLGLTVFGSMAKSADRYLGDDSVTGNVLRDVDLNYQRIFGNRSGSQHQLSKQIKARYTNPTHTMAPVAAEMTKELVKILQPKYGDQAYQHLPEATQLFLAEWYRSQVGGSDAYSLVKFGTDEPSELAKIFDKARKEGLYAGQDGAEMQKRIQDAAKQTAAFYSDIGDVEVADRILGAKKAHSVPNLPTKEGREELSRLHDIRQDINTGVPKGKQRFQTRSITDQTHYVDDDGTIRRFFDNDRALADKVETADWLKWKEDGVIPQSVLDFTAKYDPNFRPDPKRAKTLMETVVDDVKSFDILEKTDPDRYLDAKTFPTDIFELESLRGSRLWGLTGDAGLQFYNDSVPLIMANRVAQHERAWAMGQARILAQHQFIPVNATSIKAKYGEMVPLGNGMQAKVVEALDANNQGRLAVKIGSDLFRTIDKRLIGDTNELEKMLGTAVENMLIPNVTANRIEDLLRVAKDPGPMLAALDNFTTLWKTVTLTNPSWLVNNAIGNSWLAFSAGLRPQDVSTHGKDMISTWWNRHNPEITDKIKFTLKDGRTISGTELVNFMYQNRAWDNSLIGGESLAQFGSGAQALESAKGFMQQPWDTIRGRHLKEDANVLGDISKRYYELAGQGKEAINGSTTAGNAAKATANVLSDRFVKYIGSPTKAMNQGADDVMKGLLHLSLMEQGYDASEAVARTTKALFDYGDLTATEAQVLRRIIPFYSWIRSSTSYSLKMMMENPKYAAIAPKLQEALDDSLAGERKLPQNLRPGWMRENLAVQVGSNPETRQALLLMSGLPVEQLYHFLTPIMGQEGVQDFIRYYGNSTHPLFKYIFGATAGVDPFSGRTIGNNGDMTLSQYTAQQFRPLNELGIGTGNSGALGRAYQQGGIPGAASRFLVGGKFQDMSDDRVHQAALREAKKAETALRIRLSRAQNNGDDTLDIRVKLMALYKNMLDQGLTSDVPKWARESLQEVTSP